MSNEASTLSRESRNMTDKKGKTGEKILGFARTVDAANKAVDLAQKTGLDNKFSDIAEKIGPKF